jgi:actin related protein 2/3 complex, subunit 2
MQIHYRDEEAIYVQAAHDRVTVIFSTIFKDETDKTFGKVFLQVSERDALPLDESTQSTSPQEFVDVRRLPALQNAPQVLYSARDPPLEIRDVAGLKVSDDVGYMTFG